MLGETKTILVRFVHVQARECVKEGEICVEEKHRAMSEAELLLEPHGVGLGGRGEAGSLWWG